jgi:hypothetical protein
MVYYQQDQLRLVVRSLVFISVAAGCYFLCKERGNDTVCHRFDMYLFEIFGYMIYGYKEIG